MKEGHYVCRCIGLVNVWRGDGSFRPDVYRVLGLWRGLLEHITYSSMIVLYEGTNHSLKYLHPAHASIWRWIFLLHAVACIDVFIILVIDSEPTSVGFTINHRGSTPNLNSKPTN
jgi:hypothetical protein